MNSYTPRVDPLQKRVCGTCMYWVCVSKTSAVAADPPMTNPLGSCQLVTTVNVCLKGFKSPACSMFEQPKAIGPWKIKKEEEE